MKKMKSKQESPDSIIEVPDPNIAETPNDQSGMDDDADQDDFLGDIVPF